MTSSLKTTAEKLIHRWCFDRKRRDLQQQHRKVLLECCSRIASTLPPDYTTKKSNTLEKYVLSNEKISIEYWWKMYLILQSIEWYEDENYWSERKKQISMECLGIGKKGILHDKSIIACDKYMPWMSSFETMLLSFYNSEGRVEIYVFDQKDSEGQSKFKMNFDKKWGFWEGESILLPSPCSIVIDQKDSIVAWLKQNCIGQFVTLDQQQYFIAEIDEKSNEIICRHKNQLASFKNVRSQPWTFNPTICGLGWNPSPLDIRPLLQQELEARNFRQFCQWMPLGRLCASFYIFQNIPPLAEMVCAYLCS